MLYYLSNKKLKIQLEKNKNNISIKYLFLLFKYTISNKYYFYNN